MQKEFIVGIFNRYTRKNFPDVSLTVYCVLLLSSSGIICIAGDIPASIAYSWSSFAQMLFTVPI